MASFFTARAVLPWMLKQNYGRILHIASIAGKEGNAGMLAYSASKAAVIGMTKVQGKEYAETGHHDNALAPAVIQTPMVDAMPPEQVQVHDRQDSDEALRHARRDRAHGGVYCFTGHSIHDWVYFRYDGRKSDLLERQMAADCTACA